MRQKLIILGLLIGLLGFGKGAAFADSKTWPFTTAGNYTISDEEEVEAGWFDGYSYHKAITIDNTGNI